MLEALHTTCQHIDLHPTPSLQTRWRLLRPAAQGTGAQVIETRKTVPGLRVLDKWGVLAGGGANHRIGLFDMVMIKDNHVTAAGGITPALKRTQACLACRTARCCARRSKSGHTRHSWLQRLHPARQLHRPLQQAHCPRGQLPQ